MLCTSGFVDDVIFSCTYLLGQIQIRLSPRRSELFTVTRRVAPLIAHPGAKSVVDCFISICIVNIDFKLDSDL